jgi:hypothetical protein
VVTRLSVSLWQAQEEFDMSTIDETTEKYPDRTQHCPMCGSGDVDFGNRSMAISASTTVLRNGCGYTESGGDADSLYLRWTQP